MEKQTLSLPPFCSIMRCLICCLFLLILSSAPAQAASAQVKFINHRGYNVEAPENTLPAFELSWEKGFSYVETDVSFTRDLVPVLLHDATINRTARNADGSRLSKQISIMDITYEEALAYDFGIWKGSEYSGTKIPTFADFLQLCQEKHLHPYIELKNSGNVTEEQIRQLVFMVSEKGMLDGVTWISFNPEYLRWVRDLDPSARLGVLQIFWLTEDDFTRDIQRAKNLQTSSNEVFLDINPTLMFMVNDGNNRYVSLCREAGIPLEAWTINETYTLQNLDPYFSGVTSDRLLGASY